MVKPPSTLHRSWLQYIALRHQFSRLCMSLEQSDLVHNSHATTFLCTHFQVQLSLQHPCPPTLTLSGTPHLQSPRNRSSQTWRLYRVPQSSCTECAPSSSDDSITACACSSLLLARHMFRRCPNSEHSSHKWFLYQQRFGACINSHSGNNFVSWSCFAPHF